MVFYIYRFVESASRGIWRKNGGRSMFGRVFATASIAWLILQPQVVFAGVVSTPMTKHYIPYVKPTTKPNIGVITPFNPTPVQPTVSVPTIISPVTFPGTTTGTTTTGGTGSPTTPLTTGTTTPYTEPTYSSVPVEPPVPTEVKFEGILCDKDGSGVFGRINCVEFRKQTHEYFKTMIKEWIYAYHKEGFLLKFQRGNFCKSIKKDGSVLHRTGPYCNIVDGENSAACGTNCRLEEGGEPADGSCVRENAFAYSSRVENAKGIYEKIVAQIKDGVLQIHKTPGSDYQKCGQHAQAIHRAFYGNQTKDRKGLENFQKKYAFLSKPTEGVLNTSVATEKCTSNAGVKEVKPGIETMPETYNSAFGQACLAQFKLEAVLKKTILCEFSTQEDESFRKNIGKEPALVAMADTISDSIDVDSNYNEEYRGDDGYQHWYNPTSWYWVQKLMYKPKFDIAAATASMNSRYLSKINPAIEAAIRAAYPVTNASNELKPYTAITDKAGTPIQYPPCVRDNE